MLYGYYLYGYYGWIRHECVQQSANSSAVDDHRARPPASPIAPVRKDAPPFFVVHGDQDTALPVEGARQFAQILRGRSRNPVVYVELPGAQHNFDLFHSIRNEAVIDGIEAFAAWVRAKQSMQPRNTENETVASA